MAKTTKSSKDWIRIQHILDAAAEAGSFVENKSRKHLTHDRKLLLSLTKEIEIIGEAAAQISKGFYKNYSDIPWESMIATRNRLIHGYFDIDANIIWDTVHSDLPVLLEKLKKILPGHLSWKRNPK